MSRQRGRHEQPPARPNDASVYILSDLRGDDTD